MFASSVLNLAELLALRPDLAPLKKVCIFKILKLYKFNTYI